MAVTYRSENTESRESLKFPAQEPEHFLARQPELEKTGVGMTISSDCVWP